jgi:glucokinase
MSQSKADACVVGVDIGGTNIKIVSPVVATSEDPGPYVSSTLPTAASRPAGDVLDEVAAEVRKEIDDRLTAIGVALAGNVDARTGTALFAPALGESWTGYGVADHVAKATSVPVAVLNDVHAMTLAEASVGAGRGATDVLCVAVGTGVGGGLVLSGQVRTGVIGTGAIGHTTVEPSGLLCVCGNHGCVEVYASGPAIAAQAGQPTAQAAARAAGHGDPAAVEAFARAGRYLGIAVANVVTMVTPSVVVVGGGVSRAGDLLLDPLRAELVRRVRVASLTETRVVPAACGTEAGALGAAFQAVAVSRSRQSPGGGRRRRQG